MFFVRHASTLKSNKSLEHFVQAAAARQLWRDICKAAYTTPPTTRNELIAYARSEFDRRKNESDILKIRYYISTGTREFQTIAKNMGISL
ncbi:hypothetical protein CJU89_3655 [Yarrowia sp. B02]|nr:hypothetical protein CJU89_3655 [Yarrowia sp. B02]